MNVYRSDPECVRVSRARHACEWSGRVPRHQDPSARWQASLSAISCHPGSRHLLTIRYRLLPYFSARGRCCVRRSRILDGDHHHPVP